MREDSSSQPTFSLQTPNFLGLGVTNLELDRISGPCLDLGPMTEADKTSNSCSRRGIKRVSQETGAGLEVKSDGSPASGTGEILGAKKIRVSETIYGKFPSVSSEVEGKEKGSVENGAVGFQELESETEEDRVLKRVEEHVRELDKVGPLAGCVPSTPMGESIMAIDVEEGEEKWKFDLNVPFLEADYGGSETGLQEYTQVGPVITDGRSEIIAISSDESEDECQELVGWRDDRGKEKENEKGLTYESIVGFDLDLGIKELDLATAGSSLTSGGRRFTREEKGKAKLVEPWLSLSADPRPVTLELFDSAVSGSIRIQETSKPVETRNREESEFRQERVIFREREDEYRNREILERRARARRFALSSPQREDCNQKPLEQEQPSAEADMDFVDLMSPFPTALRMIRERNLKQSAEQLIKWKPSQDHDRSILTPLVPSLLDLCLKVLAKNADAIVSLEPCPDALRQRFTDLLCDSRQMNVHALDLLLRGSPTEIRIKDCSWITEEQFTKEFGSFDTTNLRVLQLNLCGQCVLDDTLGKTLARSSNNLPGLGIISLRGACRLSDNGLKALVASAPSLCSINLGQCSLLTNAGINILADSLGSILRELYIDDCNRIDAMLIAPALKKFEHLEVLSVAGIQSVCDGFVSDIITSCGRNIKELDLADCPKLTDISLKVVGKTCSDLRSLNISNLHKLTDLGIQYLAIGCKSLQTLKLCRNGFSDEAIAAFLEVSGGSLKELSLNNVVKVGPSTALSLAKYSRKLLSLDISWCRRITDEALGLIVDSCLSLKLLKLFGCTQIKNVFLNGNSNSLVRIIGLNMTPILEHVNMLEAKEVLLRYSPLPLSYDSQNMQHQDV